MCVKVWCTAQSRSGERVWCRGTRGPCGSQDEAAMLQPPAFLPQYHPRRAMLTGLSRRAAVTNLFGTRDRFRGRQFLHRPGGGDGFGMTQGHHICYAATDLAGGGAQGERERCSVAAGTDKASLIHRHLPCCEARLLWAMDWGPLLKTHGVPLPTF